MVAGSGMTDQSPIQYISALLDAPATISVADNASIKAWQEAYPYFVPIRYAAAVESIKIEGFSSKMMSSAQPYLGNWMLFCDFIDAAVKEPPVVISTPVIESVVEPLQEAKKEAREPQKIDEVIAEPEVLVAASPAKEPVIDVKQEEVKLVEGDAGAENEIEELPAGEKVSIIENSDELISAVYTQDYFLQQGERIPDELPDEISSDKEKEEAEKALMVMMSFSEWLLHFKSTTLKQQEEKKDQKALKTMWQKEKLAAALEEENEEIPENVFEMAVNSITKEDGLASESLAEIYIKPGKYDKAMDMYRKLSLRNPQKNAYFARKIEEVLKEKQS